MSGKMSGKLSAGFSEAMFDKMSEKEKRDLFKALGLDQSVVPAPTRAIEYHKSKVSPELSALVKQEKFNGSLHVPFKNELLDAKKPMTIMTFEKKLEAISREQLGSVLTAILVSKKAAFVEKFLEKFGPALLYEEMVMKRGNSMTPSFLYPLILPVLGNDLESFQEILPYIQDGPEIDLSAKRYFSDGQTLLHFALAYCEDFIVLNLLQKGRFDSSANIRALRDTRLFYYAVERSSEIFKAFLGKFDGDPREYPYEFSAEKKVFEIFWQNYQARYFHQHQEAIKDWFPTERTQKAFSELSPEIVMKVGPVIFLFQRLSSRRDLHEQAEFLSFSGLVLMQRTESEKFLSLMAEQSDPNFFFELVTLPAGVCSAPVSLFCMMLHLTEPKEFLGVFEKLLNNLDSKDKQIKYLERAITIAAQLRGETWIPSLINLLPEDKKIPGSLFLGGLLVNFVKTKASLEAIQILLTHGANPMLGSEPGVTAYDFIEANSDDESGRTLFLTFLPHTAMDQKFTQPLMRFLTMTLQSTETREKDHFLKELLKASRVLFDRRPDRESEFEPLTLAGSSVLLNPAHGCLLNSEEGAALLLDWTSSEATVRTRIASTNVGLLGESLTHLAVRAESLPGIKILKERLSEFFNPWAQNAVGDSPLSLTFVLNLPEVLERLLLDDKTKLLQPGFEFCLNRPLDIHGNTLAHALALMPNLEFCRRIFSAIAPLLDWNLMNQLENTAFELACLSGNSPLVLALLFDPQYKINPDKPQKKTSVSPREWLLNAFYISGGKTPQEIAVIELLAKSAVPSPHKKQIQMPKIESEIERLKAQLGKAQSEIDLLREELKNLKKTGAKQAVKSTASPKKPSLVSVACMTDRVAPVLSVVSVVSAAPVIKISQRSIGCTANLLKPVKPPKVCSVGVGTEVVTRSVDIETMTDEVMPEVRSLEVASEVASEVGSKEAALERLALENRALKFELNKSQIACQKAIEDLNPMRVRLGIVSQELQRLQGVESVLFTQQQELNILRAYSQMAPASHYGSPPAETMPFYSEARTTGPKREPVGAVLPRK